MRRLSPWIASLACALSLVLPGIAHAGPIVSSASGANPAAIQPTVDAFRATLGGLNPNVGGSFGTGRRGINWDGGNVNNTATTLSGTPFDFFNATSPRGTVFTTPGSGFVQAPASGLATTFGNASHAGGFPFFSQQRSFSPTGSNVADVNFFVPGTSPSAFTRGFGAVFSDVDAANGTSLQSFDVFGNSLGAFFAPTANNVLTLRTILSTVVATPSSAFQAYRVLPSCRGRTSRPDLARLSLPTER